MNLSYKGFLVIFFYIISTSFVFISLNSDLTRNKKISLFFQDTDIKYKIDKSLALDPNNGSVVIPRMLHNKVTYSFDTFTDSVYKSLDPVFLFSLSNAPLFFEPTGVKMLSPIEFPAFMLALIYTTRKWRQKRRIYIILFGAFITSIIVIGLFLPQLHPLKLLPLIIVLRLFIAITFIDILKDLKWTKKYFS